MNEKENMLLGKLYNANDEKLVKERYSVKDMCKKYNDMIPSDIESRVEMIAKIFGKTGNMPDWNMPNQ